MTVAELVVKIGADVSDLKRGLLETQAMLMGLDKSANSNTNTGITGWFKSLYGNLVKMNSAWMNWIGGMTSGLPVIGQYTSQMGMLAPLLSGVEVGLIAVAIALAAIPVIVGLAVAVLTILADLIGTLAALLIDLAGPLAIVIAGFAMLGGGLMLGVTTALKNNWSGFDKLHDIIGKVSSAFSALGFQLARDFLPYIIQGAQWVLKFADYALRLAKMDNLSAALKSFSTTGIGMLKQVNDWLYKIISTPVKLVFGIAFGGGGEGSKITSGLASMLKPWESLGGKVMTIIEGWFDRLHLTTQGIKLGHELLDGIAKHVPWQEFGMFLLHIVEDGLKVGFRVGVEVAKALMTDLWHEIESLGKEAWSKVEGFAKGAWDHIRSVIIAVVGPQAWSNIASIARSTWTIIQNLGKIAWDIIKIAIDLVKIDIGIIMGIATSLIGLFDRLVVKTGLWHDAVKVVHGIIGSVSSVFSTISSVVSTIVGDVKTLVGWVQKVANAASSIHFP